MLVRSDFLHKEFIDDNSQFLAHAIKSKILFRFMTYEIDFLTMKFK